MNMKIRQNVLPVIAALIWGVAFVAQSVGADYVGPFTFNASRFTVGALFLLALIFIISKTGPDKGKKDRFGTKKDIIAGSLYSGITLVFSANLQQLGIAETSAGKAGFITALYIVLVPIFGLFIGKKVSAKIWIGTGIAMCGLYFLCVSGEFKIVAGDVFLLMCAALCAIHILIIDHFSLKVSGPVLSCGQLVVAAFFSGILMLLTESPTWESIKLCAVPILYVGIFSSGIAYTLQIVAQKGSNPTVVSLLLSLESVFSVIAGALILNEVMSGKEYLGCALMMAAVVLVQLPGKTKNNTKESASL